MAVNIEVNDIQIKYPMFMISYDGLIVLMKDPGIGFSFDSEFSFSNEWDMSRFKPFTGSITLSNE